MWRTGFALALATLGVAGPALAQPGRIAGTVTSADGGQPVPGAQVIVVGTQTGAVARDDGRYTLTIQPGTYRLRAVRIGFSPDTATVTVTSGAEATANFTLRPAPTVLTGVVTVGYGEQEARDLTGVAATVGPETFNTGRIVAPEQLIQGKIAGVQVVDNNEPGGGMAVRIRGGTSVNASNDPLYVVDGVPLQVGGGVSAGRNPLNFINPQDIENVTVLKDASATAIYGSRGANGVVIITTKSGRSGPQFTYTGSVSGSQVTGGPDLVNAEQYRAAVRQFAPSNAGVLGTASTNWLDEIQQDATGMEHALGIGGRREEMRYRLGLGYLDQDGVLRGTRTQRASASLNYEDALFGDRLAMRAHLKGSRAKDWFTPGGVLGNAVAFAPTQPVRTPAGSYFEWNATLGPVNPIGVLEQVQDRGTTVRSVGNVEAEYDLPFVRGLSTTVRAGYDLVRADRTTFEPSTLRSQARGSNPGTVAQRQPQQQNTVIDAYGTYKRLFDQISSNVEVTAGYSAERFRGDFPSFFVQGLSTNLLGVSGIPNAVEARPFYTIDESRLVSGFARANWNIADRYLLTATVRRDGSSRFTRENQYGTFPSAAFAWRLVDEPWLKGQLPFSDLKLRVSWGKNGNQAVGNYLAFTSYTFGQQTAQAQLGNEFVPTIRPSASDPNLRWEQTTSTNVGLDFGVLDGRVSGAVDVYTKETTDLLFNVPTAAGTALSNFITTNLGSVRNRGVELTVDAQLVDGGARGFSWTANFNAAANRNRLLSINRPGVTLIQTGGIAGGVGTNIQVFMPGFPVRSFFVYEHKRDASGKPVNSDQNGDGNVTDLDLYVDLNNDRIINTADLRPFHDPAPRWTLGHTSNVSWRGFDLSTTLRAYLGSYVYNNVASNFGNYSVLTLANAPANLHVSALENNFRTPQYLSDIYVEEASFLRMDNLTLGYTFGRLPRLDVQSARVFGTVQNVFTSTGYGGVDPTAGVNGIDNNIYPRSRTLLAGVTLGF